MERTERGLHRWHDGMETPKPEFSFTLLHGTPQDSTHILEMTDMNTGKVPEAQLDKIMSSDGATISLKLSQYFRCVGRLRCIP